MAVTASLAFVTGPAASPTVTESLTADPTVWLGSVDDFDLGAPTFEGDPETGQYGPRTVGFTLKLIGSLAAVSTKMKTISRQVLASRNWLSVQWAAGPTFFLRTYRTAPESVSWTQSAGGVWTMRVTLTCDPFLYGAPVTLASVTINNDPANATNPCLYVLPAIIGDAPAPLRARIRPNTAGNRMGVKALLSVIGSNVAPTTQVRATRLSEGTDTTYTASGSANDVGGNYHAITFATDISITPARIRYSGPILQHGGYKVLIRLRASNTNAGNNFRLQLVTSSTAGFAVTNEAVVKELTNVFRYVDMGVFDWPPGGRIDDDFLTGLSSTSTAKFNLRAERLTTLSVTLYVDEVILIPVDMPDGDADTLVTTLPITQESPDAVYIDGRTKTVRAVVVSSDVVDVPLQVDVPAASTGQFPYVVPGVTNVARFFQSLDTTGTSGGELLTTSATVVFSYAPMWLHAADQ